MCGAPPIRLEYKDGKISNFGVSLRVRRHTEPEVGNLFDYPAAGDRGERRPGDIETNKPVDMFECSKAFVDFWIHFGTRGQENGSEDVLSARYGAFSWTGSTG